MLRMSLLVVAALGCKKKEEAKPAPPPVVAADAGTVDAAAATTFLPAKIGDKDGIIFAENAGGKVEGIPDGTHVPVVAEKEGVVGSEEDATLTVEHAGKKVELKADRVLREGSLH